MPIKCNLSKLLQGTQESQIEFARRIGVSRQTINKLYSGNATGIEFNTLEKVCQGLRISVGEFFVLEESSVERELREASEVTIILGKRLLKTMDEAATRFGIGPADIEALSYITEEVTRLSNIKREIKTEFFSEYSEWISSDFEKATDILKKTQGVLFVIAGDLPNGFTRFCLETILKVGYDGRGKTRKPLDMKLPYKMALGFEQDKPYFISLDQQKHEPRGIWDMQNDKLLFEIPNSQQIERLETWEEISDGAIVYIDSPNSYHPYCLIIGIAGFGSKGTSLTTKHFLDMEFLKKIDSQLRIQEGTREPIFVATRVTYNKAENREKLEYINALKPLPPK